MPEIVALINECVTEMQDYYVKNIHVLDVITGQD